MATRRSIRNPEAAPFLTNRSLEKFMNRFDVDPETGCWNWTGATFPEGYGQVHIHPKPCKAHRVSYMRFVGPIPSGLTLDHLCRNRGCINPEHLEPVTMRENTLRGVGITAQQARKTHCKRGHEFTPENTYVIRSGGRMCRACQRERYLRIKAQGGLG